MFKPFNYSKGLIGLANNSLLSNKRNALDETLRSVTSSVPFFQSWRNSP